MTWFFFNILILVLFNSFIKQLYYILYKVLLNIITFEGIYTTRNNMREILNYILKFFFKEKIYKIKFREGIIKAYITDPIAKAGTLTQI